MEKRKGIGVQLVGKMLEAMHELTVSLHSLVREQRPLENVAAVSLG